MTGRELMQTERVRKAGKRRKMRQRRSKKTKEKKAKRRRRRKDPKTVFYFFFFSVKRKGSKKKEKRVGHEAEGGSGANREYGGGIYMACFNLGFDPLPLPKCSMRTYPLKKESRLPPKRKTE